MICLICQRLLLTAGSTPAITGQYGQRTPHHRSCATFRHSVERGCYVCNRLWATLVLDERHYISASYGSESHDGRDDASVDTDSAQADHAENFITAFFLEDGRPYGHPGCYLLSLALDASSLVVPERVPGRGFWRATLLLQPHNGMIIPEG